MSTENIKKLRIETENQPSAATGQPQIRTMPVRMTTLHAQSQVEPLKPDEWQLTDRVTRRLHEALRTFLNVLPAEARNASGLARFLGVDRTTCQRLVFTATRPFPGSSIVDRLPGVRGMRQVVQAARKQEQALDADVLSSLSAAIDRFDEALRILGGSQSAVIRRIAATSSADFTESTSSTDEEPTPARRRLFEAAAEVTGRFSETWVAVYVYTPIADGDREMVNVARAHGLVGHVARSDAVPLTFHNFTSKSSDRRQRSEREAQNFRGLNDTQTINNAPDSVLREFSTDPLPMVSSRQPGEYLVQAIDTDPSSAGHPVDLMLATQSSMLHPATQPPEVEEVWAMINFPARRMVFDVYLHRDLARQCIPALDVHLWRPDFAAQISDRWQTRFADSPRLELLGQGMQGAATPAYPRHHELTSFLFSGLQLDSDRYVGYRCMVTYPLWRTGYCMSFDFSTSADDS